MESSINQPLDMNNDKKPSLFERSLWVIFSVVTVLALLLSGISALLALIFLGNFNFSNTWHLFVFAFTFAAPVVSVAGYLSFSRCRSLGSKLMSVLAAFSPFLIPLIWSLEGSRGLVH
jgi:hypothetical protein